MDVTHITSDRGYARLKGTVISSSQSKGFRSFPLHTDPLQITSSKQWPNFSLAAKINLGSNEKISFIHKKHGCQHVCLSAVYMSNPYDGHVAIVRGSVITKIPQDDIFSFKQLSQVLNCSPCQKCLPGYLLHVLEQVREN